MNRTLFTLGILCVVFFSRCSSVYMPNVPNTPMLSAPGELHVSGQISLRANASFNSAYAVSEHVGILLNGAFMNSNHTRRDFRHNLLEAGAGYFTTFGPQNNRILEIYGGLGRGNSDRSFKERSPTGPVTYERQEVSFDKYFMQVNYSSKRKSNLRLFGESFPLNYGTALRLSYLQMDEFTINDEFQVNEDNVFIEPVFYTRMALGKSVQLQYTTGSNFGLKNRKYLTAGNSVFSVGVVVNVGGRISNQ